jgi:hypothetical protein
MQQVADWLEKLGLGQYARRFAENDIDFALFTKLTDADLKNSASSRWATESGCWKRSPNARQRRLRLHRRSRRFKTPPSAVADVADDERSGIAARSESAFKRRRSRRRGASSTRCSKSIFKMRSSD